MGQRTRIALVVSHPIQHFCPQYASFSRNPDLYLKVFFGSALGLQKYVDPSFNEEISWGNLKLDRFEHMFLNGDRVIPSGKNLDAPALDNALDGFKPELIIIYGYYQKLQRRAYRWAVRFHVPLAYISDSEFRHSRNIVLEFAKRLYLRTYFSRIKYFLTVGDANEAYYKKCGVHGDRLIRMHFPIDVEEYQTAFQNRKSLREAVRTKYGIEENDIVVSVVGKLTPWKNQEHIIDALEILDRSGINYHLMVIGSGECLAALKEKSKRLAQGKTHFTGFVKIEDLPGYYAACDVYVHPASLEPHSIAISEAIYMGCPVIISNRCGSYGPTDDVQEGVNGYVFTFGNIHQLAEKIRLLGEDSRRREQFGIQSHEISLGFQHRAHSRVMTDLLERTRTALIEHSPTAR